jgi:hypothetical protein
MQLFCYVKDAKTSLSVANGSVSRLFRRRIEPLLRDGVDTIEDIALRITQAAISMACSIPLGAQAHVAVETVDVLRNYGLKGIYGLILRREFLAAADLLCRACNINQATFPLQFMS